MEPRCSLLCSQDPATGPYPELDESSAHPSTLVLYCYCHDGVDNVSATSAADRTIVYPLDDT
jgi:hypothetical protein